MSAAENNQTECVRWLLKNGADPNRKMPQTNWTAMHAAAKKNNYEVLEMLLDHGGNLRITAVHRELGKNLTPEDCTADDRIIALIRKWEKKLGY